MARTRGTARLPAADRGETSLDAAMRAPSTTTPDVVVLDFVEEDAKVKLPSDPTKDLWLSTVDGYVNHSLRYRRHCKAVSGLDRKLDNATGINILQGRTLNQDAN